MFRRRNEKMSNMEEHLAVVPQEENAAEMDEAGVTAAAEEQTAQSELAASELERVTAERDELRDRVARLQAEFENARKRTEREKVEFRDFAVGAVVEKFLPVLDNFELALKSTGSAEQLRSGVELIVKQMEEVLKSLNVTVVATVGEQFDPHVHEALGSVERDDMPDHAVADEIRRGYKMREKLLRPAMVRVVSNTKQKAE
jgi:molecular chaperone GrpE